MVFGMVSQKIRITRKGIRSEFCYAAQKTLSGAVLERVANGDDHYAASLTEHQELPTL